jgi:adenosine deaminase
VTATVAPDVLRRLPKVELHCHLEGSLRATTLIELAARHDVPLPTRDPELLYRFADLAEFLVVYELACLAVVTRDDFARVTYEALEDAAAAHVVHREMFFNPTLHPGVAYDVMLAGILDGVRAAASDLGISTRLIPSIYRQMSVAAAVEMLDLVVAHRADEVVGIGMDGDELRDPPERFAEVYARAAAAGLHRTAHVAHDGPSHFITTCLEQLGCERVDHGYHVIDDPVLVQRLADEGVAFLCATPTPPLCGWPAAFDESPIRTMIESGLTVVLNSDDPTMLGTDLATEFERVGTAWSLSPARVRRLVTDAIAAAWLDDAERRALAAAVVPELDRLLDLVPSPDGAR